jgi:hypothetical protein
MVPMNQNIRPRTRYELRVQARRSGGHDMVEPKTMAHDAEIAAIPPTTKPVLRSPVAERMHRYRERRRNQLRCLTIELREREIDALIGRGLLKPETGNVAYDVQMALYAFLDATLGAKQVNTGPTA